MTAKDVTRKNWVLCGLVVLLLLFTVLAMILLYTKVWTSSDRYIDEDLEIDDDIYGDDIHDLIMTNSSLNVIFIVVDDLRPELGSFGAKTFTPNIDQLAARGFKFNNVYAQQSLCAPSRTSFLTSRRPDSIRLYEENSYWRVAVGNFTTIPQHFKENGYYTVSMGKVFHHGKVSNQSDDYPYSWSELPYHPPTLQHKMDKVCPSTDGTLGMNLVCPVEVEHQPGKSLPDIETTQNAINFLNSYPAVAGNDTKPFFLAVGYYKPHIPLKYPSNFLDLYPLSSIDLPPNHHVPSKMPPVAWNPWMDIRLRDDVKKLNVSFPYGPIPESFQKQIIQSYYAATSYLDNEVGQLLDALHKSGHANNTMVIFTADHGWSLGEHQEWAKYSNFETAVRVPFIIYLPAVFDSIPANPFVYTDPLILKQAPAVSQIVANTKTNNASIPQGLEVNELVELVDLFPTVSALCGLPIPPLCAVGPEETLCTEGVNLVALMRQHLRMRNPIKSLESSGLVQWKTAAFSQYPRPSLEPRQDSDQPVLSNIKFMGYTMRTKEVRYTEWVDFDPITFRADWSNVRARELYFHFKDPMETDNVADNPVESQFVKKLSQQLRAGWRNALPRKI